MGLYDREYYQDEQPRGFKLDGPRSVTVNLIILTVAIFFIDLIARDFGGRDEGVGIGAMRVSRLTEYGALHPDMQPWALWQFVSYAFLHASPWHLFFNMLTLFFFGTAIESFRGRREFVWFYLGAAAFGGLVWFASALVSGAPTVWLIGASAATTAVVMWFVFNYPNQTIYLWGVVGIPAWALGTLMVVLNVVNALRGDEAGPSNVAYTAHLGGALFAAIYHYSGFSFSRFRSSEESEDRRSWTRWLKRSPKLRVHDPEEEYEQLDAEADRILAKIHEQGEASLTRAERRTLEQYSRRMRQKLR